MRSRQKRLGQNFLVDPNLAGRIVDQLGVVPPRVLEIGPGQGALTGLLLERFERVAAVELDEHLAESLGRRFGDHGLELHRGDALRLELEPLLGDDRPWQVVANLPYSVGTAIVRRLLPRPDLFSRLVVMLQLEVVQRLVARPGESAHGLLALERAAWADAAVAFDVRPGAFRPRPKVMSRVVVLDLRPCPVPGSDLAGALSLAAHALTRRRKTLPNALRPLAAAEVIAVAGLDLQARPGELTLEDWVRLARATRQ